MIGGANYKTGITTDFFCDDATDIANLEQFAIDNDLKIGSSCFCIDTGDLYIMKSDRTWKKQ